MGAYAVPGGEHGGAIVAPAFGLSGFAAITSPLPANAFQGLECAAMVRNLAINRVTHRFASRSAARVI